VGAEATELVVPGTGSPYDRQRRDESRSRENVSAEVPSLLWDAGKSPVKVEQPAPGSRPGWAA